MAKEKVRYVRRSTPVRTFLAVASTASCVWMGLFIHGIRTGEIVYQPRYDGGGIVSLFGR